MNPKDLAKFRVKKLSRSRKDFVLGQLASRQMPSEVAKDLDSMLLEFRNKPTVVDLDSHKAALAGRLSGYAKIYDPVAVAGYWDKAIEAYSDQLKSIQTRNS